MADREVTCTVLSVLSEKTIRNTTIRLQIVQWNSGRPTIEAREYWRDKDGVEKTGKAKGLSLDDYDLLLTKAANIRTMLVQNTPAA